MDLGPTKILYRIQKLDYSETRAFVVEIPCDRPAKYRVHDHDYERSSQFYNLKDEYDLGSTQLLPMTSMVKVKSSIYGYMAGGTIMRLNIAQLGCQWEPIKQPSCPHRWDPKLISLRDRLYIFGGIPTNLKVDINYDLEPFGEVYDPDSDEWSSLVAPPQTSKLNRIFDFLFVASLGEYEGRIMVYVRSCNEEESLIYSYDVDAEVWETRFCSALDSVLVNRTKMSGFEVFNKYDQMVYWLDKRTGFINAFHWKRQQLYFGPIVGLSCEHDLTGMIRETDFVSLHHLSRDLFCLFWPASKRTGGEEPDVKTELHFTVLKVVRYASISALDAFVVGCRQVDVSGSYWAFDALRL